MKPSTIAMRFVDTNILLYATSVIPQEARKRLLARELLNEGNLAISVQVLQEFYYQATRSNQFAPLTHNEALDFLVDILQFPIHPVTLEIFQSAVAISQRFQISYWDAAILAAARALSCDAVYSEDLNPGQDYDGLRIINPFTAPVP